MKTLFALVLVAALGAGGWFYWKKMGPGSAETTVASGRPVSALIETRSIRFAVSAAGDIGPAEQVSVRPEVNGKIDQMPVDVGDLVKKDALLFKLDDRDLQIEKESQEKAVQRTQLELEQVEREFKRSSDLFENKLISQELFEDARTRFQLAKNSLDRAQNAMDLVLDRLRRTQVTAPFDCTVLTRPVSVGQAVSGSGGFNAGTEVLTIANLSDLVINAHINQADVTRLTVNQEVDVTVEAIPGLRLKGKVERLAPQSTLKNNVRGFAARILLKDVDRTVRPGMTANISIPVASAENVVAAPLAAVFTETNPDSRAIERYVYVKKGEGWERRSIEIGVSDYFFAEITKGLAEGEEVSLEDKGKSEGKDGGGMVPGGRTGTGRPAGSTAAGASGSRPSSAPASGGSNARPAATSTR